jgi:hypothetical protein
MSLWERIYSDFVAPYGLYVLVPIWLKALIWCFGGDAKTYFHDFLDEAVQTLKINPGLRMLNFVGTISAAGIVYLLIKSIVDLKDEHVAGFGVIFLCIFVTAFLLSILYARNERR